MSVTVTPYFTPSSIAGCQLWLDATDTSSLTGSSPVTAWKNKIIPANNIPVVATAAGSPSISATAINGNPAMYFNGSSYFTGAISAASSTTITIFMVGSLISPFATFSGLLCFGNSSQLDYDNAGSLVTSMYGGESKIYGYRNGDAQVVPVTANVPFILVLQHDGTYVNTWLNGTTQTSANIASSGTFTYTNYSVACRAGTITGQYIWSGYFGEILVYQSSLTSTQRTTVEAYLAQKWGLTSSLPSGHIGLLTKFFASSSPAIQVTPYTSVSYAFAPTQITGCRLWLDAQDNSTISLTSGYVSAVADKALGTSFTSVGPTPANLTVASASINSYQSFYFNNAAGNYVGLSGNLAQLTTGTAIFVMKYISSQNGSWRPIFGWNDTSAVQSISFGTNLNGTGVAGPYVQHIGYNGSATATLTNNGLYIVTFTFTGTTTGVGYNGQISLTAGTVSSYSGSATSIGICTETNRTQMTTVYLGEIIIYNTVLGSTDRQKVESYLAQKWGIRSSLAATHPGLTTNYFLHSYITNRGAITTLSPASKIPINLTGLIIYYSFDNAIYDLYNVASLNLTGSISYVTGRRGQALSLTNTAAVAPTNYLSSSYVLPSTFTVSLWFQTPNTSVGSMVFCAASNISLVTGSISIYFSSGYLGCAYSDIANNGLAYAISANTWYHAAITYNSGSMLLYVNGSLSGNTVTGTNSKSGFTLGGGRDTLTQYPFTGYIDDLRIYNRILTGSELTAIYNGLA